MQGFLSSVLVSSFPNRKLNLRFGFFLCKSATTSQARSLCHYWYASSPGRGALVSAFFFHQFLHHSVFSEKHQQRHAEQVEDDGFAEQDLAAVDEEALHKRGRREHIRQHRTDEHRVGQHDRHGHEPVLF